MMFQMFQMGTGQFMPAVQGMMPGASAMGAPGMLVPSMVQMAAMPHNLPSMIPPGPTQPLAAVGAAAGAAAAGADPNQASSSVAGPSYHPYHHRQQQQQQQAQQQQQDFSQAHVAHLQQQQVGTMAVSSALQALPTLGQPMQQLAPPQQQQQQDHQQQQQGVVAGGAGIPPSGLVQQQSGNLDQQQQQQQAGQLQQQQQPQGGMVPGMLGVGVGKMVMPATFQQQHPFPYWQSMMPQSMLDSRQDSLLRPPAA